MHQTRSTLSKRLPIPRKGTKYLARSLDSPNESVSVLIALREMLGLARTLREVKHLIHLKKIKLNGKVVSDFRASIKLFNIFEADKKYLLTILPTGRFGFTEYSGNTRFGKVIRKTLVRTGKIQIGLHDNTTLLVDNTLSVGDSVELDLEQKIKKVHKLQKGANVFIISGKNVGKEGSVLAIDGSNVTIQLEEREVTLHKNHVFAK